MRKPLLVALASILGTSLGMLGCTPKDKEINLLYERFHGKYKIISSTSSEPLDVNFDGVASTNLLQEIVALANDGSFLELRVKY